MTETAYLSISQGQLALSALLILINVGLSWRLRLGLASSLGMATARTIVQLLLIGYILEWLFQQENPLLIVLIAIVMTSVAGISGVNRTNRRFAGIYWNSLLSILASSALITGISMVGILRIDPWFDPQYLIPLLGMILGNTLNGISLGLERFMESLVTQKDQIEGLLALGATRWEAAHEQLKMAIRVGMIPIINSMSVVGLVSLPGMMTGQILAGASPGDAVRYQIVIMFMIASGTALGTLGVVFLAFLRMFNSQHQLRLDRLSS